MNSSLDTANDLAKKLADLNQDMVEWLVNYANTKGYSNVTCNNQLISIIKVNSSLDTANDLAKKLADLN